MKAIVFINTSPYGYFFLADSAVSNTGKPFYLPENLGETCVCLSAAIRVSRLGKCIREKFAPRYYSKFAPALHFFLPEYARKLKEMNLPEDPARNFDKALFVGDLLPFNPSARIELALNGEKVAEFSFNNIDKGIDSIIEEVSLLNTLKMGDIILPGLSNAVSLKSGDILEVGVDGVKAFQVRVK